MIPGASIFSFDRWMESFAACGLDPYFYACRAHARDEILPWRVVRSGVDDDYLWRERENAYSGNVTPDCRVLCTGCGASGLLAEGGRCDD